MSPKIALTWLDDGTDRDLASTAAGDNPDLDRDDLDRAERIAAAVGLAGLFRAEEIDLPATPATEAVAAPEAIAYVGRSTEGPGCLEGSPEINNAGELSDAMITSAVSDLVADPSGETQRTREALGTLLAGGGFTPGAPVFGVVGIGVVGIGLGAWDALHAGVAGLYPTRFTRVTAEVSPNDFAEDAAQPGSWSNVEATAVSTGWSADEDLASVYLEILSTTLSIFPPDDVTEALLVDTVGAHVNAALGDILGSGPDGVIRFCAETWTVDITDLPFSTAQVLDRAFDVDPATRTFRPTRVGPDVLRIAPVEAMFGGRTAEFDDAVLGPRRR